MPNPNIDNLVAEVTETKTVHDSVIALLNGLSGTIATIKAELAALGIDNATLNQLGTDLSDSTDAVAAAVVANTPAE